MRAVVQRVAEASVTVDRVEITRIGPGLVALVGVAPTDTNADADTLADKLTALRIFPDDRRKMNRSVTDVAGEVLVVSQFTLLADVRKGRRPSFAGAAAPETAEPLIGRLVKRLEELGVPVRTGRFGSVMQLALTNDGPVTIVVDTREGRIA